MTVVRYIPTLRHRIVVPLAIAAVLGVPYANPPLTLIWFAIVLVTAYAWWSTFVRCIISDDAVEGRDPESLRKSSIQLPRLHRVVEGNFSLGNIPGYIAWDDTGKQSVFLPGSAVSDLRVRSLVAGR